MAQKLITLEEAAQQLGISKELLLQLRTEGKVAGYRDGASWKFRSEVIDRLAAEGIPSTDSPPSDIGLDEEDELGLVDEDDDVVLSGSSDIPAPAAPVSAASGLDLELADEPAMEGAAASDISLDDVDEPTVAGMDEGSSDALALDMDESIDMNADSILLSEAELGESMSGSPSTIIGKGELDLDADLDLSPIEPAGPVSDVKLAPPSDIIGGTDDLDLDLPSPSGDFQGLEELEVDLEAESSRIMSPEDVAKVKGAVAAKKAESDLKLAPSDSAPGVSGSDVNLGGSMAGSATGLTGLSALELEDDDDDVLGEGSDVTLSGESSGINIISPSDSGLALDEVKLDLSGSSPMGSSLDLGGSAVNEVTVDPAGLSALGLGSQIGGGDFQLTPLGEGAEEDEERDSSQVIALDELSEEAGASPLGFGAGESGMLADDFGAVGLTPGVAPVGVVSTIDTPFSAANIAGLSFCLIMLGLGGMMVFDLLRNIWSWDEVTPLNSSLMESFLNPFL
jgi:excisionase family DNA binding protein